MLDKICLTFYNADEVKEMKKTLYSLLLDESVVREIDVLAHRSGLSRSALVNRILAEYAQLETPESRVEQIFTQINRLMLPFPELVPMLAPNAGGISLKSALDYKYRPTIRYEVELEQHSGGRFCRISLFYRTRSEELLQQLNLFFRYWVRFERAWRSPLAFSVPEFTSSEGCLTRTVCLPPDLPHAEELARQISDGIRLFDELLKQFINHRISAEELEKICRSRFSTATFL